MTNLKFIETHDMVAFLSKPAESEGFEQIMDFLNANPIRYALTINPTIYTSCIKQFWATVKVKTVNGEVQLQALVDGKKIIITESTVRRDLQLEDAEGVDCLPNSTISEHLTLMGYEKICQKLTFYKAFFSPQWKFLIHTILQCLSSKTTAWNEFSSTMASAIIYLATEKQKPRKPKRKDTQIPQSSGPTEHVADEAVYKELDDSLVRAATTASSLDAEQNMGNINKTQSKATPNKSSSLGTTSGGGPRCQEIMGDTTTRTRFESVSKHSNDSLLARGFLIWSRQRPLNIMRLVESSDNEESLGEDASKLGRIDAIDADEEITLVSVQNVDEEMFDVNVLDGEEVFVAEQEVAANKENDEVNVVDTTSVATTVNAATTTIDDDGDITLAQALIKLKVQNPRTKGLLYKSWVNLQQKYLHNNHRTKVNKARVMPSDIQYFAATQIFGCYRLVSEPSSMSSDSSARYLHLPSYTKSEPRVFWGADEELLDGALSQSLPYFMDTMDSLCTVAPHLSPDYIMAPRSKDYPRPIRTEDECGAYEQPLPPIISPTVESPGYVVESDPEEDPEEYEDDETEDGPVDYPMDRGEDGDDDDSDLHRDDVDDEDEDKEDEDKEDEEEEEEANSAVVVPTVELVSLPSREQKPLATTPHCTLLPLELGLLSGFRLPYPFHQRQRYEVGESSTVRTYRGRGEPMAFFSTFQMVEVRQKRDSERFGYGIRDTWVDPAESVPKIAPMTVGEVNTRVTEFAEIHEHDTQDLYALVEDAQDSRTHISQLVTMDSQRVDLLMKDRIAHQETVLIVEEEAYAS
ncbi:hypothetical protein Tco_0562698 [Tanacetum coccineum]